MAVGTVDSGKTTFAQQLLIADKQLSREMKAHFVGTVRAFVLTNIQKLATYARTNDLGLDADDEAEEILDIDPSTNDIPLEKLSDLVKILWEDDGIQEAYKARHDIYVSPFTEYFAQQAERIFELHYTPTEKDCIFAKSITNGYNKIEVDAEGYHYAIYDCGGSATDRKKWDTVSTYANGILLFIGLDSLEMPLIENRTVTKLQDSFAMFTQVFSRPENVDRPLFVLFSKFDIFAERIQNSDYFSKIFPQYNGDPHDVEPCFKFIQSTFEQLAIKKKLPEGIQYFRGAMADPVSVAELVHNLNITVSKYLGPVQPEPMNLIADATLLRSRPRLPTTHGTPSNFSLM